MVEAAPLAAPAPVLTAQEPVTSGVTLTPTFTSPLPTPEPPVTSTLPLPEPSPTTTLRLGVLESDNLERGWQLTYNAPNVALFSGAATAEIPLEVPAGRNGLQPDLRLSYNSRRVDGLLGWSQDWVGAGWSIETLDIVRTWATLDANGAMDVSNRSLLLMNGAAYELVPATNVTEGWIGRYYAKDAPQLYVEMLTLNSTGELRSSWIVRTPDGTTYRLGTTADASQYVGNYYSAYNAIYRWRLAEAEDVHGNKLQFSYHEQRSCGRDAISLPSTIRYNNYGANSWASELTFVRSTVYPPVNVSWDFCNLQVFGEPGALERVEVRHLGQLLRRYGLTYGVSSTGRRYLDTVTPYNGAGTAALPATNLDYVELNNKPWCPSAPPGSFGASTFAYPRLSTISNGYGAVEQFTYAAETNWGDWDGCNGALFNYQVQQQQTYDGLHATPAQQTFTYTGVYTEDHLVKGYGQVTALAYDYAGAPLRETRHEFHNEAGASNDDLRGRELCTEVISGTQTLHKTETTWEVRAIPNTSAKFVVATVVDNTDETNVTVHTTYEYDGYGNVTREYQHGVATAGDERSVHHEYHNIADPAAGRWLIGLKWKTDIYSGTITSDDPDRVALQTYWYYDDPTHDVTKTTSTHISKGNLTMQGQGSYSQRANGGFVTTQYKVDNWGNTIVVTDTRGYPTTTAYDLNLHLYPLQQCNALNQCASTQYYGVNGVPTDTLGLPGQVKQVLDPNGVVTARYTYDTWGRLQQVYRPRPDGGEFLALRYEYADTATPSYVDQITAPNNSALRVTQRTFYDGLGRAVQSRLFHVPLADTTFTTVVEATEYDALGRAVCRMLPVNGGQQTFSAGLVTGCRTNAYPRTVTRYDALGQVVRVLAPDGATQSTVYGARAQTSEDANQHLRLIFQDTYGRLRRVEETLEAWKTRFDDLTGWVTAGAVNVSNGVAVVTGAGNWSTSLYRPTRNLGDEQGVAFTFRYDPGAVYAGMFLDSGTYNTSDYRRWGLEVDGGQLWRSTFTGAANERVVLMSLRAGVWYRAVLKIGGAEEFILQVWERDAPEVRAERREVRGASWANRMDWRFMTQVHTGVLRLDEYVELNFYTTDYTYDVLGNLKTVTDAATPANVTTMEYDALGRKTGMTDPDMGSWVYRYDTNGNLIKQRDARNQAICFYYDSLNRLTGKTYHPNQANLDTLTCTGAYSVTYTYDQGGAAAYAIGRRTGMSNVSGSTTWTYDLRGRITQELKTITGGGTFKTKWGYDDLDHVAWMQYPNGNGGGVGEVVTYAYLPQGTVNTLSGASQYVQGTSYDAAGRIVRRQYGTSSALTTQYTYFPWTTANGQGRLQVLQTGTATTYDSLQKLAYTYDVVGNVMSITDTKAGGTQIQAFTYDALDRLKTAQASGGTGGTYAQQTYTYDQLGNLTNNGNGTLTYGTQSAAPTCPDGALTKPHAVVSGNGNTYCYDANGNQVRRTIGGAVSNLNYDAENRLTTVSGATSASFVYDGDGNRVKSVLNGAITYYVGNHFEWRSTTSNMTRYYYADGQRVAMRQGSSTLRFLLGDHLGSTAVTATSTGGKYAEQRYYPWGGTRWPDNPATPTARRYTGQIEDAAIGLYFYNARYYDPALGRFLQADTIVPNPANPQSLNRYSYTLGNPLKYTDPSGHKACLDTDCTQFENTVTFMKESPRSPSPHFTRLPLEPTNESTSQWFGGTNFAHNHGTEWNYGIYCQGFHCGIDIGRQTSEYSTPVYAGLYGIVESIGEAYGAGPYAVNVRVGDYIVIYGHLDGKYNVGVGDAVTPDTIIGGVGNPTGTEGKGNVHLHLEIRYQNRLIYNPLRFIGEPGYKALTTVMNPNDFYYTDKWATPLDQPVIQRGGPSLWKDN